MTYTDLRVIMFGRNMLLDGAGFKKDKFCGMPIETKWVSLGHFDSIFTYSLNSQKKESKEELKGKETVPESGGPITVSDTKAESMLSVIGNQNMLLSCECKGNDYYHPLYVVRSRDENLEAVVNDFWQWDACFMQITRVHSSLQEGLETLEENISTLLSNEIAQPYCNGVETSVRFICYRAMELSDIVIIMKSNTFLDLVNTLRVLYANTTAYDIYTHYAVNYRMFSDRQRLFEESGINNVDADKIPYISIRFSVHNPRVAQTFVQKYTEKLDAIAYVITGTDDVNITRTDLPVIDLLDLVSGWLENQSAPDKNVLRNAFSDVITRIGNTIDNVDEEQEPYKDTPLTKAYIRLMNDFSTILSACYDKDNFNYGVKHCWLRPAHELLNSLINLSRSCVLSDLGYIFYDGVRCFFNKLKGLPDKEDQYSVEVIQRFVNNWSHMMEMIIRMEGQMIKQPESRPLLYDVPPRMLEFNIAFAKQYSEYLQAMDEQPRPISLFIVPGLCERITAYDEMSAVGNNELLISVELPIHLIYDPFAVTCSLCHEVSHFCGEKTRCRENRLLWFLYAVSTLIARYLDLKSEKIIGELTNELYDRILSEKFSEEESAASDLYMKIIVPKVVALARSILADVEYITGLRTQYSATLPSASERIKWLKNSNIQLAAAQQYYDVIRDEIDELRDLFRECYADIAMISTLDIKAEDYIALFEPEFRTHEKRETAFARIVQRVAAVLFVMYPNWVLSDDDSQSDFSVEVSAYLRYWNDEKKPTEKKYSNSRYFPLGAMIAVAEYLKECKDALQKEKATQQAKERLKKIQELFKEFACEQRLDCDLFESFMMEYRDGIKNVSIQSP